MLATARVLLVAMLIACSSSLWAGAPEVGADAPKLSTAKWYNNPGNLNWEDFKGKVILIEKWAST